jgi:hypothetical protein
MDAKQFLTKLSECVKEYKKQIGDTRDEQDAAYFFNPALKKFLADHPDEMKVLSTMNFDRSFMSFLKTYLLK